MPWEKILDYGVTFAILAAVLAALWLWLPKIGSWAANVWEQQMQVTQKLALSMENVSVSMKDISDTLDRVLVGQDDIKALIKNQRRRTSMATNGKRNTSIREAV